MTSLFLYVGAAVIVLSIGFYGLFTQPHLLKKLLSLNISAAGIFLLLISFAGRSPTPDPVPHALVLTGIVISVSTTAYGIVLAARLHRQTGCATLENDDSDS